MKPTKLWAKRVVHGGLSTLRHPFLNEARFRDRPGPKESKNSSVSLNFPILRKGFSNPRLEIDLTDKRPRPNARIQHD